MCFCVCQGPTQQQGDITGQPRPHGKASFCFHSCRKKKSLAGFSSHSLLLERTTGKMRTLSRLACCPSSACRDPGTRGAPHRSRKVTGNGVPPGKSLNWSSQLPETASLSSAKQAGSIHELPNPLCRCSSGTPGQVESVRPVTAGQRLRMGVPPSLMSVLRGRIGGVKPPNVPEHGCSSSPPLGGVKTEKKLIKFNYVRGI